MNESDAYAMLEEANFHADADRDRRLRLDLKRRLKLAGLESDLAHISDVTVLRQLLDRQTTYRLAQPVEVEIPHGSQGVSAWLAGSFSGYELPTGEGFRLVAVTDNSGTTHRFLPPERVRPAETVGPFPVEPAPGSPEAVQQAAQTLQDRSRWTDVRSKHVHLRKAGASMVFSRPGEPGIPTECGSVAPLSLACNDPEEGVTCPACRRAIEPEAVAQAAETIRPPLHPDPDNPDEPAMCRWCDRPAVILNSVCGKPACFYHEDDSSEPHAIPYAAIVRQRNKAATDLETSRLLCGRLADALEAVQAAMMKYPCADLATEVSGIIAAALAQTGPRGSGGDGTFVQPEQWRRSVREVQRGPGRLP